MTPTCETILEILSIPRGDPEKSTGINGIGAILDPEVGYYDISDKNYKKKTFNGRNFFFF